MGAIDELFKQKNELLNTRVLDVDRALASQKKERVRIAAESEKTCPENSFNLSRVH